MNASGQGRIRGLLHGLKPGFLNDSGSSGSIPSLFSYRRVWLLTILLVEVVALGPLLAMAVIDNNITRAAVDSEVRLRTTRIVSNAKRSVSFYLQERKSALQLILSDNEFDRLTDPARLRGLLDRLKESFGGFVDLGVIDAEGRQRVYVGPYSLSGRDYRSQPWFPTVLERGSAVSDVFLGYRNEPHLIIALRGTRSDGAAFILRATLDTQQFNDLVRLELMSQGDAFIINDQGVLQTPSLSHGGVLEKIKLPVPNPAEHTEIFEAPVPGEEALVVGYAYVPDSPFILMVTKSRSDLLMSWTHTRYELLGFLLASILAIVLVVLAVATFLVNRIHMADMTRMVALRQAEHAGKMASIGRLAAGVAHEINNPLAVIGEKAGLMKDLMTYSDEYKADDKLLSLVDVVLRSVERCGTITRRLLGFARHLDVSVQTFELDPTVHEVLDFLHKEAEYRSIGVQVDIAEHIPTLTMDRGKFQQVLLNLVNNAFAAVQEGGHVAVRASQPDPEHVAISVADDGCGIAPDDLKRIFEPFFSTKKDSGGTGLGLSISYGLAEKMGGHIQVESEVGKGSKFTLTLPVTAQAEEK
ncbi:MAG: ATP-binding protein [Desulfovibrionaceae bacterium]